MKLSHKTVQEIVIVLLIFGMIFIFMKTMRGENKPFNQLDPSHGHKPARAKEVK